MIKSHEIILTVTRMYYCITVKYSITHSFLSTLQEGIVHLIEKYGVNETLLENAPLLNAAALGESLRPQICGNVKKFSNDR